MGVWLGTPVGMTVGEADGPGLGLVEGDSDAVIVGVTED